MIGLQISLCTASKIVRAQGPLWFHGLWIKMDQTAASGQTIGLVMSNVSGTWTQSKVILPKQTLTDSTLRTKGAELMNLGTKSGIRCTDGLWLYLPKIAAGGSTVTIVWS